LRAYAGLIILHGIVAAVMVEALLRLWRVRNPGERVGLRWLALAAPLILPPFYVLIAPFRSHEQFAATSALFAGVHWGQLRLAGAGVDAMATIALAAVGCVLYLRDAIPFLDDRVRGRHERAVPAADPAGIRVLTALATAAARCGIAPPDPTILDRREPVLLCAGIDRPALIVSTGALDRLTDVELEAALVHELSHVVHRDALAGWILMLIRTLAFFSPAAQIVGRQLVHEFEYRADLAVTTNGDPAALARAIGRLAEPDVHDPGARPHERLGLPGRLMAHASRIAVDQRCERVFESSTPSLPALAWLHGCLAAAGIGVILFLVV
jgi:Zn-dependent protease with chaperone function